MIGNNGVSLKMCVLIIIICVCASFVAGVFFRKSRHIPFVASSELYSIGIYKGNSPFTLEPVPEANNPVLTAKHVTDVRALYVADPFMANEKGAWYMFFEVLNADTDQGDIGLAVSPNAVDWEYKQIVLDEPYHLSYPYVFKWKNEYYMIPETVATYSIRLYKAVEFPTKWSFVTTLLRGNYFDSSIFHHNELWWIFAPDRNDILHLFYSADLIGPWAEHPKSPVVFGNPHFARPAGRVIVSDGKVFRFAQDCEPVYGHQVYAFEITELTTKGYAERAITGNPILKPTGHGWNGQHMHHVDCHKIKENQWLACVDGRGKHFRIGH
jgi:hypothetical protein